MSSKSYTTAWFVLLLAFVGLVVLILAAVYRQPLLTAVDFNAVDQLTAAGSDRKSAQVNAAASDTETDEAETGKVETGKVETGKEVTGQGVTGYGIAGQGITDQGITERGYSGSVGSVKPDIGTVPSSKTTIQSAALVNAPSTVGPRVSDVPNADAGSLEDNSVAKPTEASRASSTDGSAVSETRDELLHMTERNIAVAKPQPSQPINPPQTQPSHATESRISEPGNPVAPEPGEPVTLKLIDAESAASRQRDVVAQTGLKTETSQQNSNVTQAQSKTAKPETAKPETAKPETAKPETAKPLVPDSAASATVLSSEKIADRASAVSQGPSSGVAEASELMLSIDISDGVARLGGTLPDIENSRGWSSVFANIDSLQVIDDITYVRNSTGPAFRLTANWVAALQAVDIDNSELQFQWKDDSLSLQGFTTTVAELAGLKNAWDSELSHSNSDNRASGGTGSDTLVGQPDGAMGTNVEIVADLLAKSSIAEGRRLFSVVVNPLTSPLLNFRVAAGTVSVQGFLAERDVRRLQSIFAGMDDFTSSVEARPRVRRLSFLRQLKPLLLTVLDTMREATLAVQPGSVRIGGQLVSGDVVQSTGALAALLPAAIKIESKILPPLNESVSPLDPVEVEKQTLLVSLQQNMRALQFARNDSQLNVQVIEVLDRLFETLFLYADLRVSLRVHSDDTSKSVDNLLLSRSRANNMAKYLSERGLEKYRVSVVGVGDTRIEQVVGLQRSPTSFGAVVEVTFSGN